LQICYCDDYVHVMC